jgi:hypothetical protein
VGWNQRLRGRQSLDQSDEKMPSLEKDRAFLEASVPELEDYLLSDELYWPITARGFDLPRLTIGGILLAKARLEARGERIEALLTRLDAVRSNRVMLQLLLAELPASPPEAGALSQLDSTLRLGFASGDFIWETDLQRGFSPGEYWFLYGRLRS